VSTRAARRRGPGAGEWLKAIEAAAWLTLASCVVRALPFRIYARLLGKPAPAVSSAGDVPSARAGASAGASTPAAPVTDSRPRGGARALGRAANPPPWHTTCLVRVVAGALMLRMRGMPRETVVGVAQHDVDKREFHAWLISGDEPISGTHQSSNYVPIWTFR